ATIPPWAGLLYAVQVPPYGADTLFSNQCLAWTTLSPGMKDLTKTLKAVHSDIKVAGPQARLAFNGTRSTQLRDDSTWTETQAVHPVVCRLPENRKPYLFVNASYTQR